MASATEQPQDTGTHARRTAASAASQARMTSEEAQRKVRSIVRNSAYATIGVGDLAVSAVRNFNARTDAAKEFERLNQRGRALVEGMQRSGTTSRAREQADNARSQVKAAATSVARATRLLGQAAEDSVTKVGDDAPVDYESKTLDELRELARERNVSGRSTMSRDELVLALQNA